MKGITSPNRARGRLRLVALAIFVALLCIALDRHLRRRTAVPEAGTLARSEQPAVPRVPSDGEPTPPSADRDRSVRAVPPRELPVPVLPDEPPPATEQACVAGRVVDVHSRPIERAEVIPFLPAGGMSEAERTDDGGRFVLDGPAAAADRVVVRCSGFATRTAEIERGLRTSDTHLPDIVLSAGAAVTGRVRLSDGRPPDVPVRVLARWPTDLVPDGLASGAAARLAGDGDPRTASTLCDASGDFRIEGVPEGSWCTLFAGGAGLGTVSGPTPTALAGGSAVEILLAPLYVIDLRLRESDGTPLRISRVLRPSIDAGVSWSGPMESATPLTAGSPAMAWAAPRAVESDEPFRTFVAYAVTADVETVGPFNIHVRLPGYEPLRSQAWARRLSDPATVPQEIRLERTTAGFGRLTTRIDDEGTGLTRALREAATGEWGELPSAKLVVSPLDWTGDGAAPAFCIPLAEFEGGRLEIDGVPCGPYACTLELPLCTDPGASRRVEVQVDATTPAEASFTVSEWAGMDLRPDWEDGARGTYRGPLFVTLRRAGSKASAKWRFRRAPYIIVGVAPGRYAVDATSPWFTGELSEAELKASLVVTHRHRGRMRAMDAGTSK